MSTTERTVVHTCPLCEATCGLAITTRGREIVGIRGDDDDVFSRGFICPKAYALKELDADPDRLRTPLVRRHGRHGEPHGHRADGRRLADAGTGGRGPGHDIQPEFPAPR